jgi:hypothetical protein
VNLKNTKKNKHAVREQFNRNMKCNAAVACVPGVLRELWTQELANKLPEFDSDKDGVLSDSELLGFLRSLGVFKDACLDEIAEEIAEQAEDLDPDYVTEDGVTTDGLLQCYVQDSIKDAEDVRDILKALNLFLRRRSEGSNVDGHEPTTDQPSFKVSG